MSDSDNPFLGGLPPFIYAQIVAGAAIQVALFFLVDAFWAICATPLAFAAFAAVNLTDLDPTSERRIKRWLTWLTFGSIAVAVVCRMFLFR